MRNIAYAQHIFRSNVGKDNWPKFIFVIYLYKMCQNNQGV